jgi:Kef-type K+ transport system membrane component KefB
VLVKIALLSTFALLAILIIGFVLNAERSSRRSGLLARLGDPTSQVRVRGAFVLLGAFVALAGGLGLAAILGAFSAGMILRIVDTHSLAAHPQFRMKLDAVGFGVFIPVYFVASGMQLDLPALFAGPATVLLMPLFLAALLFVRGVPALLYRPQIGTRGAYAAGLLQATSLTFIVPATQIGLELKLLNSATAAALVAAVLLSVLLFPLGALSLLPHVQPVAEGVVAPDA